MITKFHLLATVCSLLSTGVMCVPHEPSPHPVIRDTDLILVHSGGVAGIAHRVRITPEGQLFVSQRLQQEEALGALSNEQGNRLNALLADWDMLPSVVPEPPTYSDAFEYAISYRSRSQAWSETQENVPDRLWELAGLVVGFEQDLSPEG